MAATTSKPKKQQRPVADSWEDEDSGDDTDRPLTPQASTDMPSAPPPTPSSPTGPMGAQDTFISPFGFHADGSIDTKSGRPTPRPTKSDAAARRMIAGALGVRTPKKTDEQRDYEKAKKDSELKRRDQERAAAATGKQDAEKAKAAVWSD